MNEPQINNNQINIELIITQRGDISNSGNTSDTINTPIIPDLLIDDSQIVMDAEPINVHEIIDQVQTIQDDISQTLSIISPFVSAASVIGQTFGSLAILVASSNLGRKAAFTGLMYFAGGSIVSTIGFFPTVIAGSVIMLAT